MSTSTKQPGRPSSRNAAKIALREADRRVKRYLQLRDKEAPPKGYPYYKHTLHFYDLQDLEQIPEELSKCTLVTWLNFSGTKIFDLTPLTALPQLALLDLNQTLVEDFAPISDCKNLWELRCDNTKIETLGPLHGLLSLQRLSLRDTKIVDLSPLTLLQQLTTLDLHGTGVSDLSPISKCTGLRSLILGNTGVSDLAPIRNMKELGQLILSGTKVGNLSPIAELTSLMYAARPGHGITGLAYRNTPIAREAPFSDLIRLPNPARTVETINAVRVRNGLEEYIPEGYIKVIPVLAPLPLSAALELDPISPLEPIENVPAPLDFKLSHDGRIALSISPATAPTFPKRGSKRDHAQRLEACRTLAGDLISDLSGNRYQVRSDYVQTLSKYASRLPKTTTRGNILLTDAEARTLRNMFAAEADILAAGFASKLKTLLEQHIGLRVYYPILAEFYRDVQAGRIDEALPLDAVEGFVETVKENTPEVFEPSVAVALEGTAEAPKSPPRIISEGTPTGQVEQPLPPRDPLGELDPQRRVTFHLPGPLMHCGRPS